jgi:hypothetical protein
MKARFFPTTSTVLKHLYGQIYTYQALLFIQHHHQQYFFLWQTPLSALQNLYPYTAGHLVIELLYQVSHLHKAGKYVAFCCVPGHMGQPTNMATDASAKEAALLGNLTSDQVVCSEICILSMARWRDQYDGLQIASCETICASVAVFLQFHHEGWSLSHTNSPEYGQYWGSPSIASSCFAFWQAVPYHYHE